MSRDYKSKKSTTKSNMISGPLILGVFLGYALGLASAIGIWMYISQSPSPFLAAEETSINRQSILETVKTPKKTQVKTTNEEVKTAVDEKNKFDFYEILPGVEESVVEQEYKPVIQPQISPTRSNPTIVQQQKPPSENIQMEHYFLQAGSFRSTNEADNLKARLALLGVVADIQSADLAEKGIWLRVRIGPFLKMSEVDQTREALKRNNIETQFIKVR